MANVILFCDQTNGTIKKVLSDGTGGATLKTGLSGNRAVCTDTSYIYYCQNSVIYKMAMDGSGAASIYTAATTVTHMKAANGYVYYSTGAGIYRINTDGTSPTTIINTAGKSFGALFVTDTYIYYAEGVDNRLRRCSLTGTGDTSLTLMTSPTQIQGSIFVDSTYIFGSINTGASPGMTRVNLDGSGRTTLSTVTHSFYYPYRICGLGDEIYWGVAGQSYLQKYVISTGTTTDLVTSGSSDIRGIDVYSPTSVPGAPTAVSATVGNGQLAVTWTPGSDNGSAHTDFLVEWAVAGSGSWNTWTRTTSPLTTASETITGLTNGTAYDIRISGINSIGTGPASSTATATPATVPGAPTAVSGTRGNASINVTWTAPSSNGGAILTDYVIEWKTASGGSWATFADGLSTSTSATITGLTNGTAYIFRVSAVNAQGTSTAAAGSGSVVPATTPNAPTSVTVTPNLTLGVSRIDIAFSAPADNGGDTITNYYIEYKAHSSGTWLALASTGGGLGYSASGFTEGTKYDFRVYAVNSVGNGTNSSTSSTYPLTLLLGDPLALTLASGDIEVEMSGTVSLALDSLTLTITEEDLTFAFDGILTMTSNPVELTVVMGDIDVEMSGTVGLPLNPLTLTIAEGSADLVAEMHMELDPTNLIMEMEAWFDLEVPVSVPPTGVIDPFTAEYIIPPDEDALAELLTDPYAVVPTPVKALASVNVTMPDPLPLLSKMGRPRSNLFLPTEETAIVGWLRVKVNDRDLTFLRGVPVTVQDIEEMEPYGSGTASLFFPQISPFEDPNSGWRRYVKEGFDIELQLVNTNYEVIDTLFEGIIVTSSPVVGSGKDGKSGIAVTAVGTLFQADFIRAMQRVVVNQVDIAQRIFGRLNIVPGRRWKRTDPTSLVTGISTHTAGDWSNLLTGFIQDMLATASTEDGDQWTLMMLPGRKLSMHLKDRTTQHHVITLGTPGISVQVEKDISQTTTTLYGRGIDENRQGFANFRTPNRDVTAKPFPYASPAATMELGDTDAGTVGGKGVSDVQKKLKQSGYLGKKYVTGTYNSQTQTAVTRWQKDHGLSVTGEVGGQTWASMFSIGNSLKDSYYAPFATISEVEPWLYEADGSHWEAPDGTWEANPDFDPTRLRVEKYRAFPDGMSKADAIKAALAEVGRDADAAYAGTITMEVDAETTTRSQIKAGHNILVKGLDGGSKLFHIARVRRSPETGSITLTVDEKARDAITLDAIFTRDKEALGPARHRGFPARANESSSNRPVIDSEIVGWLDDLPCEAGKWSVTRIPLGTVGTIVGIDLAASVPTRFACAIFEGKITPADLLEICGEPGPLLFLDPSEKAPFPGEDETKVHLDDLGWLDTLGGPGQAAGYGTGSEDHDDLVTGTHNDTGLSLNFESRDELWVWVGFWCEEACLMAGRINIAPPQG